MKDKGMRLIVTSKQDVAGSNIYSYLSGREDFREVGDFEGSPVLQKGNIMLIATRESQVRAEHLDKHFSPEYYVFASRHRSASGERTLTVHMPGNLTDEAKVGGRPRELALAQPDALRAALLHLENSRAEKGLDYRVSLEVTHHGPTSLKRPVIFVEVGSTEEEWNDSNAVRAVASASIAAAENKETHLKGIGVGGGHYAPRHTDFVLRSGDALGHLIPSYAIENLDIDIFSQAVEKSGASFCFLDWKGMKKAERKKVEGLASQAGLKTLKRIPKSGRNVPPGLKVYKVHEGIFSLSEKTDQAALRKVIEGNRGVAFERGGHLIAEFAAPEDIRSIVLKACLEILAQKKPVVTGALLRLIESKFDPGRAIELGVKPGPQFAQLRNGRPIKVGERIIRPEDVILERVVEMRLDEQTSELLSKRKV